MGKAKAELTSAQIGAAVMGGNRLFGAFKASQGANNKAWATIREVAAEVSDIVTWNAALKQFKETAKANGMDPAGSTFNQYVSSVSAGIREGILPEADEPVAVYRKRVKEAKGPTNRVNGENGADKPSDQVFAHFLSSPSEAIQAASIKNDNTARGLVLQRILRDLQALSDGGLKDAAEYVAELYAREIDARADSELDDDVIDADDLDAALIAEYAKENEVNAA